MTTESANTTAKKPRRRLTPEQRIEERKLEIARIEEKQRQAVRDLIEDALDILRDAGSKAAACDMRVEVEMIGSALKTLEPSS